VHFGAAIAAVSVHQDKNLVLGELEHAQAQLQLILAYYQQGLGQALALDAELGQAIVKLDRQDTEKRLAKWQQKWQQQKFSQSYDFSNDPYRRWLWSQTPEFSDWQDSLQELYDPMVKAISEVKHV
jgi:exonuclease V gamma subunit